MQRRRPLKNRKAMARAPLKPMSKKRRARKTEETAQARDEGAMFRRAIQGERCAVCGRSNDDAVKATGLGHQAHHAIRKEVMKRLGLNRLLWDPDNAVCLCEEPCHRQHTTRHRRVKRSELPARVDRFAARHGLENELGREYLE